MRLLQLLVLQFQLQLQGLMDHFLLLQLLLQVFKVLIKIFKLKFNEN